MECQLHLVSVSPISVLLKKIQNGGFVRANFFFSNWIGGTGTKFKSSGGNRNWPELFKVPAGTNRPEPSSGASLKLDPCHVTEHAFYI